MENELKCKKTVYVPCELRIVKFNVEQGFAVSLDQGMCGAFANSYNSQWVMNKDSHGDYKNAEQYGAYSVDGQFDWFNN